MPGTTNKAAKAASKPTYGLGLANKGFDLDLPSGATCLAIRPGAQGLIKAGLLDSLDQLTALVQSDLIDPKDPKKMRQVTTEMVAALQMDMGKLEEGLEMVDRCVAFIVQQPKVHLDEPLIREGKPVFKDSINSKGEQVQVPVYKPRKEGVIYADQVDLDDKMFIFQWAMGGTADLKTFREQSSELLGGLSAG